MNSDVLGAAGYQTWAITGMFLFIFAFASACLKVLLTDRRELERQARLPLEEEVDHDRT